jgi:RNA polymerase sigma-70 factor (ECF subfamily)
VTRADPTAADRSSANATPRGAGPQPETLADVLARRDALLRLAYRFCWNRNDAEDALQNALLIASQKSEKLSDPAKRLSWVQSIVVRQCLDLNRKKKRDAGRAPIDGLATEAATEHAVQHAELSDALRRLIRRLPERQQVAIVLRHLEEMGYAQIAELMEIGESTVRVLVRNAREALRRALTDENPDWATA